MTEILCKAEFVQFKLMKHEPGLTELSLKS